MLLWFGTLQVRCCCLCTPCSGQHMVFSEACRPLAMGTRCSLCSCCKLMSQQ
jgi:hypothetical protein